MSDYQEGGQGAPGWMVGTAFEHLFPVPSPEEVKLVDLWSFNYCEDI